MKPQKICATCGRIIEWRKKWERSWESVRFCSESCRRKKPQQADLDLEQTIISLLKKRSREATICPSEAAREFFGEDSWRDQMERTRQATRRLVAQGLIAILQKGQVVDPSSAKGPIRLKLL